MQKTLASKTLQSEFQVITLKESTNKKKWLQVQGILSYRPIPKYLPTLKPTDLYQYQLQSLVGLNLVEEFSFAQISLSVIDSIATFNCCSFAKFFNPYLDEPEIAQHKTLGAQNPRRTNVTKTLIMRVTLCLYDDNCKICLLYDMEPQCTYSQKAKSSQAENKT